MYINVVAPFWYILNVSNNWTQTGIKDWEYWGWCYYNTQICWVASCYILLKVSFVFCRIQVGKTVLQKYSIGLQGPEFGCWGGFQIFNEPLGKRYACHDLLFVHVNQTENLNRLTMKRVRKQTRLLWISSCQKWITCKYNMKWSIAGTITNEGLWVSGFCSIVLVTKLSLRLTTYTEKHKSQTN